MKQANIKKIISVHSSYLVCVLYFSISIFSTYAQTNSDATEDNGATNYPIVFSSENTAASSVIVFGASGDKISYANNSGETISTPAAPVANWTVNAAARPATVNNASSESSSAMSAAPAGTSAGEPSDAAPAISTPATPSTPLINQVPIGSDSAQTNLDVADYGAVGDVEQFQVNTVSNSPVVTVAGTNIFSSADVGKVIEVFGAGPWVYYSNWGAVVTQQDIVCLITNVSEGTNLSLSIPCGWTMTANCTVGTNNAPAIQSAINDATSLITGGQYTNIAINFPAGTYLVASSNILNPNYVMSSISDTHAALTISSGGITLLGQSTNTTLLDCGAGMEHLVQGSLTWISGGYAPYVPMRDTVVICEGPVANQQYPLVFENLTFDGGVANGRQSYNYWTIIQGNGEGWDTTHHAVADYDGLVTYRMNQMKVFTNCVFQHFRGEMLICWTGCITNAFNDIANCTFYDGNATADNMYYGQHVHGCTFNQIEKVTEYYQANATLPTVLENNLITNIAGNILVINGATTNAVPPSYAIQNNTIYGTPNTDDILFTPAENVIVSNNVFHGAAEGISFSAAGLQPSDGTAAVMSNVVIAANTFNDTFLPLVTDGYPVEDVLVSNNTSATGYYFAMAGGGWKTNWVFANNSAGVTLVSQQVQAGQYFNDESSDHLGWYSYNDWNGVTNWISYGNGRRHLIIHATAASAFPIETNNCVPPGAVLQISNLSSLTLTLSPGISVPPNQGMNLSWSGSAWQSQIQFTASQISGLPPLAVQFNSPAVDAAGIAITGWNWTFGDGSTSSTQNPSYTYTATGAFSPSLTVTNLNGIPEVVSGPAIIVSQPSLGCSISSSGLVLTWPASGLTYSLQYATNLEPPVVWYPVSTQPVLINGQYVFTSPTTTAPRMIFRLVH